MKQSRVFYRAQTTFRKKFWQKEDKLLIAPGLLGDRDGNVAVPNYPGFVRARIEDQELVVFNNSVANLKDTPVWIGYQKPNPKLLQVLGLHYGSLAGTSTTPTQGFPNHGWTHRFFANDPTWIELRQFLPFAVFVSAPLELTVFQGLLPTNLGWISYPTQTVDISTHKPTSWNMYMWIVLYADPATTTIQILDGTPDLVVSIDDIPTVPTGCFPICAVRVYPSQTTILDTAASSEIVDLRFPQALAQSNLIPSGMILDDLDDVAGTDFSGPGQPRPGTFYIGYDFDKDTWTAKELPVSEDGPANHFHLSVEYRSNGVKQEYLLPQLFEPCSVEVHADGALLVYGTDWDYMDNSYGYEGEGITLKAFAVPADGIVIIIELIPVSLLNTWEADLSTI